MAPVKIIHYSDVVCVWAHVGHRRLEELVAQFGDQIEIETRFCSVFPDAWGKIDDKWADRGGFEGFNRHINEVAAQFDHVDIHPRLWLETRPRTSGSAHLFLKAVELVEADMKDEATKPWLERLSTRAAWAMRKAFFADNRDISDWDIHAQIADELGVKPVLIEAKIRSSEAVAALAVDYHMCTQHAITGSPTIVLNEGRQKLFGNVGYRLIEANVHELLRTPEGEQASWC